MMFNATIFPGRYIQGRNALTGLGRELGRLGNRHFVVLSPGGAKRLPSGVLQSLEATGPVHVETFSGECTLAEVERLTEAARSFGAKTATGIGGGKILDATKSVAARLGVPTVMVPTIASTDAPCSSVSVLYSAGGVFERVETLPRNPDLVLVDVDVIAKAPARFLTAGMGDALATLFEAESCWMSGSPTIAGGTPSMTALALARLCYETIRDYGRLALASCEAGVVVPALERVIEANTLLSGVGFESGGLAAAHAVHNGLTLLPAARRLDHGFKVAFGVLASLFLADKKPDLIDEVYGFCESVGLPTTLSALGLDEASDAELMAVAEKACAPEESIHHEPTPISPEIVFAALKTADACGLKRIERRQAGGER